MKVKIKEADSLRDELLCAIGNEAVRMREKYGREYNTPHEAYGVILEDAGGKPLYLWHIKDAKRYEPAIPISEFMPPMRPPQSWRYTIGLPPYYGL